jgi:hypothetical protein
VLRAVMLGYWVILVGIVLDILGTVWDVEHKRRTERLTPPGRGLRRKRTVPSVIPQTSFALPSSLFEVSPPLLRRSLCRICLSEVQCLIASFTSAPSSRTPAEI